MKSFCTPYRNRSEDMMIGGIDTRRGRKERPVRKESTVPPRSNAKIVFNGRTARRLLTA